MASSAYCGEDDRSSQLVVHPLEPIFDEKSRVLVLGTMPSPKSREVRFYYGNPQNRFWRVIAALWDEPVPTTNDGRRDLCLRHRIPNDVGRILSAAPISHVFCTGGTATRLYQRLVEPTCGMPCVGLPSTSPANARMRLGDLIAAYEPLRRAAEGE